MSTPPFAPPYKASIQIEGQERWVEVAADGSQSDCAAPAAVLGFDPDPVRSAAPAAGKAKTGVKILTVPYAQKDEAKRLGAKWDATRRKWYVPSGTDSAPFATWLVPDKD